VDEFTNNERILGNMLLNIYQSMVKWLERKRTQFPLSCHEESRDNLLAYLYVKEMMSADLIQAIEDEGLSSIYGHESHIISSLELLLRNLQVAVFQDTDVKKVTRQQAKHLIAERARTVLGESRRSRQTRIMVTLDEQLINEPETIEQLLLYDMDIARINCAHGSPEIWEKIIESVRQAEERLREKKQWEKRCRIYMDLPGPKIRVDHIVSNPYPVKLSVRKNEYGQPIQPVTGFLYLHTPSYLPSEQSDVSFVLEAATNENVTLVNGDELSFTDVRGRKRRLKVIDVVTPSCFKVGLSNTAYIQEGIWFKHKRFSLLIQSVTPIPMKALIKKGTRLQIYFDQAHLEEAAKMDGTVKLTTTLSKALRNVRVGHRLYLDDGKIFATIQNVTNKYIEARVISVGRKIKTIKKGIGMNFPDSLIHLTVSSPTDRDLQYIPFISKYADMIGLSFVHAPHDVAKLYHALVEHGAPDLTIIAKIETRAALHNFVRILLEGLKLPSFGVMIARGDLAIEVGFENMSIVQHAILTLCQAAHLPVIWATQVLENLAKKGVPARAEISDVSLGQKAQCVMLNKGPYIVDAVKMLTQVLEKEESHPQKRAKTIARYMDQHGVF
jgi:pyruvate kinase